MNWLIDYFARQTTLISLLSVFLVVVGTISTFDTRREVFPNVDMDMVSVTVLYPGASAESVEKLITNPLEQDLDEVEGIKRKFSVSSEGLTYLIMLIDPDQTTSEEAKADIKDIVDAIEDLPDGAKTPVVKLIESKQTPSVDIALSSEGDEEDVRKAVKTLERKIKEIPSVARVDLLGYREVEIRVEASSDSLRQNQITLNELIRGLQQANVNIPAGSMEATEANGFKEFIVRTVVEYETIDQIKNTVLRSNSLGELVRVGDVAVVTKTLEKPKMQYGVNGRQSIIATVVKKEKADVIDLVDEIKKVVDETRPKISPDIHIDYMNDQSFYVERRVRVLSNNLLVGLGIVLIILSLFLPVKVGLITSLGIPFAFLGSMIIFDLNDLSINLISMMGLIIVIGMLVDDAVVVTENAQRLREEGHDPLSAAIKGTQQVWAPVTVSVLTTMMAFGPLMMMSGIFGKFVRNIPLGVLIALGFSLFECFFILPNHLAHWIKDRPGQKDRSGIFGRVWEIWAVRPYSFLINRVIDGRWLVCLGAALFFAGSGYFAYNHMKFILFPPGAIDQFIVNVEGPAGSSLKKTAQLVKPIEDYLLSLPKTELMDVSLKIGEQKADPNDPRAKKGSEFAQFKVYLTPDTDRVRNAEEIVESFKKSFKKPEELKQMSVAMISGGPPVGKPVSIGVWGEHYDQILAVVKRIEDRLTQIDGVSDIQNTFVRGKDELHVVLDGAKLAAAALTNRDVAMAVRSSIDGIVATTIRRLDDEIDIRVSLSADDRGNQGILSEVLIQNPRGAMIPLKNLGEIVQAKGIAAYQHRQNRREVKVTAEIDIEKLSSKEVNKKIEALSADLLKGFPDLTLNFGGENRDTTESMASLEKAFWYAIFGIAIILILLFKNLYQPLVVMSTIPMGFTSVIWTFSAHGFPLSFLGMIGVVALAGVIVNNAIVFVDFVNQGRASGMDRKKSIVVAGQRRLRPIFLTTVTTVAGILPTAYGIGGKDPFVVPIAMALGWGMCFGAVLTALILPAVLGATEDVVGLIRRASRGAVGK